MFIAALTAAIVNFVLLVAVFAPLEYLKPARSQHLLRRDWATDVLFFMGQYLAFGLVASGCLRLLDQYLSAWTGAHAQVRSVPSLGGALLAVVAGDVLVYWFHRASHRWGWLWRFHRVHHSSATLDWLAAHREHPVDGWLTQLFQNLPALLLGVRVEILAGLVLFRNAWAIFIHSNVRANVGALRYLLGAPELHHFHHADVAQTKHNFANLAPWLDVLFGTYYRPAAHEEYTVGLSEPHATGYVSHLFAPFLPNRLVKRTFAPAIDPTQGLTCANAAPPEQG